MRVRFVHRDIWISARHWSRNIPPDIDLGSTPGHRFSHRQNVAGDRRIDIIFTTIDADIGGDLFHHQGEAFAFEGDGRGPRACLATLTHNTLHDLLRVYSSSHSSGSGSYAVIYYMLQLHAVAVNLPSLMPGSWDNIR